MTGYKTPQLAVNKFVKPTQPRRNGRPPAAAPEAPADPLLLIKRLIWLYL